MIEDVEIISSQLSVTILMIRKPVIKIFHTSKIHTCTQIHCVITYQNNSVSNRKLRPQCYVVIRRGDRFWDLMKYKA